MNLETFGFSVFYHGRKGVENYHCRGKSAWKVSRLWELSEGLPIFSKDLSGFEGDMNQDPWFTYLDDDDNLIIQVPTVRAIIRQYQRILSCDLSYPVILCPEGKIMDGFHRLVKAHLEGRTQIDCVQFEVMPECDVME